MTVNKNRRLERIFTIIFTVLTIGFVLLMAVNRDFFDWAFTRHHNVLSWYIRPLFILPLCFFAYKRSGLGISIVAFLGLTSMFWFPEPTVVNEQIQGFLEMEKEYLTTGWTVGKAVFSLVVPISMYLLCLAFWKRSLKIGVGIIVAIAIAKTLWSVIEGGEAGQSVIIPAVIGLVICVGIIYYVINRQNKKIAKNK